MTDRAKKISELQATTSVATSDKLVVLKDPATSPSTRSVTANIFAQSIAAIARADLPGATVITGNVTVASNGSTNVAFLTVSNTKMFEITLTAKDVSSQEVSIATAVVAANTTEAYIYPSVASVGDNPINIDWAPTVNAGANTTTLYFYRTSATTSNVTFNYRLTKYT